MRDIFRSRFLKGKAGAILACAVLIGLALTGLALRNAFGSERAPSETAGASVAEHQTSAQLEQIHRGKVSPVMLAHITAMADTMSEAPEGAIMQASFEVPDGAHATDFLNSKPGSEPQKSQGLTKFAQDMPPDHPSDRTFVGKQQCLACHQQEASNWAHTIHAAVFTLHPRDANEAQGCESCHGPGSAHVQNPSDMSTIISFSSKSKTPIARQNAQCLSCHQGAQRMFWHGSVHQSADLGCSDCHNPMAKLSVKGLAARDSINQTCFSCHKVQRAEFNKRSHMPLMEGKLSCTDCHNPHGSTTAPLLKADSVNELCYTCHAEKRGPFLFEHAPVRESCLNCHSPHGSNFESLLTSPRPMLCQQCHAQAGHPGQLMTMGNLPNGARPDPRLIATSCQTCHVNIHGSNSPSGSRFER